MQAPFCPLDEIVLDNLSLVALLRQSSKPGIGLANSLSPVDAEPRNGAALSGTLLATSGFSRLSMSRRTNLATSLCDLRPQVKSLRGFISIPLLLTLQTCVREHTPITTSRAVLHSVTQALRLFDQLPDRMTNQASFQRCTAEILLVLLLNSCVNVAPHSRDS